LEKNDDSFSIDNKPVKQLKFSPILDYLASKELLVKPPGVDLVLKAFGKSKKLETIFPNKGVREEYKRARDGFPVRKSGRETHLPIRFVER
jgi:hypothetical protein